MNWKAPVLLGWGLEDMFAFTWKSNPAFFLLLVPFILLPIMAFVVWLGPPSHKCSANAADRSNWKHPKKVSKRIENEVITLPVPQFISRNPQPFNLHEIEEPARKSPDLPKFNLTPYDIG